MIRNPSVHRRLAANDSYTFLMKELEKVDETILEPLSGTDWPRDMPVITGGGLIESIASVDVTYASSGTEDDNLFFEAANDIPVIQADMSKSVARTFNFAEYMSFSAMEREKMTQVGRDPETFLNKGIRLHCDKLIDRNVYRGFSKVASTGLALKLNADQQIRVRICFVIGGIPCPVIVKFVVDLTGLVLENGVVEAGAGSGRAIRRRRLRCIRVRVFMRVFLCGQHRRVELVDITLTIGIIANNVNSPIGCQCCCIKTACGNVDYIGPAADIALPIGVIAGCNNCAVRTQTYYMSATV